MDSNFIVSSTGHLLILQATLADTANYSCVARNVARQRTSEAALVTIYSKYILKSTEHLVGIVNNDFKMLNQDETIQFMGN